MEIIVSESYIDRFFTEHSLDAMMTVLSRYYPEFDKKKFMNLINNSKWNSLAIKQRMHHVTECMYKVSPDSFDESVEILLKAAPESKGWESMTLPDYIEIYGQEFWDNGIPGTVN